jgi:hypothetical protein
MEKQRISALLLRGPTTKTEWETDLLPCLTRKRTHHRQGGYVTSWAVRFIRIVSDVFLNYSNGSNSGCFMGHAGHPVLYGDTQQLVMHSETICEAFNPTQTGSIVIDPDWVAVPFTVYT